MHSNNVRQKFKYIQKYSNITSINTNTANSTDILYKLYKV